MSADLPFLTYRDVRDYAVAYLARCFASRKDLTVAAHPGRFDEAEIRRLFQQTPALLTSFMGLREDSSDDNQKIDFVSWLLVRANNQDALFDDALVLLSVLVPLLRGIDATWSKDGAERVEVKNLYTSQGGGINATLWAISWTWPLRGSVALTQISEETIAEGGILLPSALESFAGYDAETKVGASGTADHVDL